MTKKKRDRDDNTNQPGIEQPRRFVHHEAVGFENAWLPKNEHDSMLHQQLIYADWDVDLDPNKTWKSHRFSQETITEALQESRSGGSPACLSNRISVPPPDPVGVLAEAVKRAAEALKTSDLVDVAGNVLIKSEETKRKEAEEKAKAQFYQEKLDAKHKKIEDRDDMLREEWLSMYDDEGDVDV